MTIPKTDPWPDKIFHLTGVISRKTVSFCLFGMITLVACDIILRTFSIGNVPGTVEINEYLLIIVGFIGIALTNSLNGHITVDLLYDRLSDSVKRIFTYLNNALIFAFTALFFYASVQKALAAFHAKETNWFGSHVLPVWFFRWIVPFTCILLSVQILINLYRNLRKG
jgi:TRAP-type C4-dicarboxylate transport system permease small subunit